jgi:hypothetical protein
MIYFEEQRMKGKITGKSEGENYRWYLTTVVRSYSTRVIPASNLLMNVVNQSRGAV